MRIMPKICCLLIALGTLGALPAAAQTETSGQPVQDEGEAAAERAHAERLRRAIEKRDQEDAERARRRGGELDKQSALTRLQARIATLERDESMLQGDLRHAETQLLYQRRDPADQANISAHARRSELESRVSHYRSQLLRVTAEKRDAVRQLNELRLR
jgi:hypothetical protein